MRRLSVLVLTSLLLVAGMTPATGTAAGGARSDEARIEPTKATDVTTLESADAAPGSLHLQPGAPRPPAFEASIVAETPLRPRGAGRFRIVAARQRVVAVPGGLRLTVRLPRGTTSRAVEGPDWDCRKVAAGARLRCRHKAALRAQRAPKPLIVHVATTKVWGTGRSTASVRMRWRTGDGKREEEIGQVRPEVLPPLRAAMTTTVRTVKGTPTRQRSTTSMSRVDPRVVTLTGRVVGAEGRPVSHRFRQLCTTAVSVRRDDCDGRADRVRWVTPTGYVRSSRVPRASFEAPQVSRRTPLIFALDVAGDGARDSDVHRIVVKPRSMGQWRARGLAEQPTLARTDPARAVGHRHGPGLGLRIARGQRPLVVQAGARVKLRAATSGRAVGFRWSTISGPSRLLVDRPRDRAWLTFVAPKRPTPVIVGVTATDSRGRTWRRDRVVEVVPRKAANPRRASVAVASSATSDSPFCAAFAIVRAAPENPTLGPVTLGGVTTTGTCDSASATIGFTSVTIGGDTIALSGQIDATGTLTGTYAPSLDLVGVAVDTIAVTASLADDGSITGLTGSASAAGVPFVSLPTGWTGTTLLTVTTAGITLTTDASDGVAATSGHLGLTGTIDFDGTFSLAVTAANLAVLTTAAAGDATASGSGTVSRATPGGAIAYDVTASFTTGAGPDIQLFDNVTLSSASATLADTGIQVEADLTIAAAGTDLDLAVAGSYRSATDYSLAVTQPSPWRSYGVSLTDLTGTVMDNGVLTFDVAGSATDSELSGLADLSDASLSAQVTNTCPPGGGDASCTDTEVRLDLTLSADVMVPGAAGPVPLQATATVDFATMDYSFDGTLPGTFGPAELNLSDLQLTVSDDSTAPICDAGGGGGGGGGTDLTLGFSGKAAVMGVAEAQVSGVFTGDSDYCLQVDLAGAGFNPDGGSGGGSSAFTQATLLYATSSMTVTAPGGPGGSDQTVTVGKRSPTLIGTFQTPQSLQDIFDNDLAGSGAYSAAVTLGADSQIDGFDGTVELPLKQPGALLAGSRDGTSLTLDSVEVDVSYDTDQAQTSLGISADGDFNTDGGGMPATEGSGDDTFVITGQSTPVTGQITATLSEQGAGISFDVGIDPTQTTGCPTGASPCITDAFGQSGLTVSTLSVGGSIQATDAGVSPAVDVAADVDLPPSWTSSFGADGSVPASLDVQVSEANPCLSITIGNPDGEQAVVSMAAGLFTADFAQVALAPTGCTFPTPSGDVDIPAGSSLAFDGAILGDPIAFNAIMGTGEDGAPYVKATVQSAPIAFAGGAITVTDPTAGSDGGSNQDCSKTVTSNDNSPAAGGPFVQVDTSGGGNASVCGAIDVGDTDLGGAGVTVSIEYSVDDGVANAQFMVEADLNPGGFPIADGQLQGQYVGGASPVLDIFLNAQTSALAVGVALQAQLDYEGGVLDAADFRYYTNADIFGIFDVSVGFDLAYTTNPTTKVGSTTFSYSAAASLFGFSIFHFGGTIFTTAGGFQADGSPIPPPPPPPPPPIQISGSQALDDGFVEIMAQLGYPTDSLPGSTFGACRGRGCYYLYRDVSAPIAPDGSIATPAGKAGGTPGGLLLVCYATKLDQQQNLQAFVSEMRQRQRENPAFQPPEPPAFFTDPNIRSATQVPSDPTGTDGCVSLDATYNVDADGNLYIASARSFDWSQLKALGAQT